MAWNHGPVLQGDLQREEGGGKGAHGKGEVDRIGGRRGRDLSWPPGGGMGVAVGGNKNTAAGEINLGIPPVAARQAVIFFGGGSSGFTLCFK